MWLKVVLSTAALRCCKSASCMQRVAELLLIVFTLNRPDRQCITTPRRTTVRQTSIRNSFATVRSSIWSCCNLGLYRLKILLRSPDLRVCLEHSNDIAQPLSTFCLRLRTNRHFVKSYPDCLARWPTITNVVFTSYYHPHKFSPWNFVTLIVFLPCHSTAILTRTSVHLYWGVYFMIMRIE